MTLQESYAKLKIDKKKRTLVQEELRKLHLERITAGIHASDGQEVVSDSGFKLIDVAVQNEYGNEYTADKTRRFKRGGKWYAIKKGTTIKIPATRFVSRVLLDSGQRRNIIDEFKASLYMITKYSEDYRAKDLVKDVGSAMRDSIKDGIDRKIFDANSQMTIDIKGFDKRLFDTGKLYNAIKYRSKKAGVKD